MKIFAYNCGHEDLYRGRSLAFRLPLAECIHTEENPTLKGILLHLNFIKFVGSDDDAVIGEMNTAAGF